MPEQGFYLTEAQLGRLKRLLDAVEVNDRPPLTNAGHRPLRPSRIAIGQLTDPITGVTNPTGNPIVGQMEVYYATSTGVEAVGLQEKVYNFSTVSHTTDKWKIAVRDNQTGAFALIPQSDGTQCHVVRFKIVSSDPATRTALVEIQSRPVGCSDVPESDLDGTVIQVCDPMGCFLNEPNVDLTGRDGWARYMQPVHSNICQPDDAYLVPQWEIFSLCCATPECDSQ